MGVRDDAATAAERHDRGVDQFRKFENFIARMNGDFIAAKFKSWKAAAD